MNLKEMMERYEYWVEFSKLKYKAEPWILISIGSSVAVGILSFMLSAVIIKEVTLVPLAFFLAALVLTLGYPYMKKESIIDSIEDNFSDALKQMADTLKAGDTYESALREVANAEYGRLSEEINIALRRLEEGANMESALMSFAERVDSRLVKRTITIIVDSVKTGASLAEVLDEISEDVRDIHRLKEDRKANTQMQFMFMVAAGGFIAPMIFGEVTAVLSIFNAITTNAAQAVTSASTEKTDQIISILIQGYIIIEVVGSGVMMAVTREGKPNKAIIYIPLLLLTAFIIYYTTAFVIRGFLAGSI